MQKDETGHLLYTPQRKINPTWIKRLEHRTWNHKTFQKNIDSKCLDIGLGDKFLDLTPKAKAIQTKTNKWDNFKPKGFANQYIYIHTYIYQEYEMARYKTGENICEL